MLCPSRTIREVGGYRRRIRESVRRERESSSITELGGLAPVLVPGDLAHGLYERSAIDGGRRWALPRP
jgi:hypothetical protein